METFALPSSSPLKIAMVFVYLHSPSGNAQVFLSLAQQLQQLGHQVNVFTYYFDPDSCFPELLKGLNVSYVTKVNTKGQNLSVTTLKSRFLAAIDYYIKAPRIATLMKSKYDVIFASESCAYLPALKYQQKNNTPIYWSVFDPITLADNAKPGSLISKYPWFGKLLQLHTAIDRKKISKLNGIIVPTKAMKHKLDELYGIDCIVFPTAGIDATNYATDHRQIAHLRMSQKMRGFQFKKFLIFSHAHFQPHRRYEDIIKAFALLDPRHRQQVTFLISGKTNYDPPYFQSVKKLITDLELEKTVLIDPGYKTPPELIGYYQLADIFVFVPIEQTWGLAPFEAMACGKPVVLSDGVGCAEVLTPNHDAMIVPAKDPQSIAEALAKLIDSSQLRNTLGTNGKELSLSSFSYAQIAQKLVRLFTLSEQSRSP